MSSLALEDLQILSAVILDTQGQVASNTGPAPAQLSSGLAMDVCLMDLLP